MGQGPPGERMFVAIFPAPAAVAHLDAALSTVRVTADLRWQPPPRWHLTVAFLGNVAPERADRIKADLEAISPSLPDPTLRMAGGGTFRTGRGAGVVWVGIDGEGLSGLAGQVRAVLLPEGRSTFRPHVTVARWRAHPPPAPTLARTRAYAGPPFAAQSLELVRSHLGSEPRYEPVQSWPLGRP